MFSLSSASKHEKGQGLVEYAIILALVAIVVIAVMSVFGQKTCFALNSVANALPGEGSMDACGTPYDAGDTGGSNLNPEGYDNPHAVIDAYCAGSSSGSQLDIYVNDEYTRGMPVTTGGSAPAGFPHYWGGPFSCP